MTAKKNKTTKGADSGTQYSHWTKNPHEEVKKKEIKIKKIKLASGTVNVYKAEYGEIDKLLDDIRKECRAHGLTDYACTNIKNLLEDTLKKVRLSEN